MKLLIITQAVDKNNPVLGFFHRWIEDFSNNFEKVTVICLEEGKYNFPANVKVLSLGKESGTSRLKYLWRFYKYLWQERKNYDAVFVHMNQVYVVLGGFFWRFYGKKVGLWYVHRQIGFSLWLAEKLADVVFTASKEGFRLKSNKLKIVGHGVPFEKFYRPGKTLERLAREQLRIISVGRITPIKDLSTLIKAAKILAEQAIDFKITLVGGAMTKADDAYLSKLEKMINKFGLKDRIIFVGAISNDEIKKYYWESDLSINLAPTGGIDKVVLESIASGLLVLVANRAFSAYFGKYLDVLIFRERDPQDLASKIVQLTEYGRIDDIKKYLLDKAKMKSDLPNLIKNITAELK